MSSWNQISKDSNRRVAARLPARIALRSSGEPEKRRRIDFPPSAKTNWKFETGGAGKRPDYIRARSIVQMRDVDAGFFGIYPREAEINGPHIACP